MKQSQFPNAMLSQDEYERLRKVFDGQLNAVQLVLQKKKITETHYKLVLLKTLLKIVLQKSQKESKRLRVLKESLSKTGVHCKRGNKTIKSRWFLHFQSKMIEFTVFIEENL